MIETEIPTDDPDGGHNADRFGVVTLLGVVLFFAVFVTAAIRVDSPVVSLAVALALLAPFGWLLAR